MLSLVFQRSSKTVSKDMVWYLQKKWKEDCGSTSSFLAQIYPHAFLFGTKSNSSTRAIFLLPSQFNVSWSSLNIPSQLQFFFSICSMILRCEHKWSKQETVIQHIARLIWRFKGTVHRGAGFWKVTTSHSDRGSRNYYLKEEKLLVLFVLLLEKAVHYHVSSS